MSYDIDLKDPVSKETIELDEPHAMKGGAYRVGSNKELHLTITYNYSEFLYNAFGEKGIRGIYGMTGLESIPVLDKAINKLGDDAHTDYWQRSEGNTKRALIKLLTMAKLRPDGVWDGD